VIWRSDGDTWSIMQTVSGILRELVPWDGTLLQVSVDTRSGRLLLGPLGPEPMEAVELPLAPEEFLLEFGNDDGTLVARLSDQPPLVSAVLVSSDGVAWHRMERGVMDVASVNGQLLAVGSRGEDAALWRETDRLIFESTPIATSSDLSPVGVVENPDGTLSILAAGRGIIARGEVWRVEDDEVVSITELGSSNWRSIGRFGDRLVAYGNNGPVAISDDGGRWGLAHLLPETEFNRLGFGELSDGLVVLGFVPQSSSPLIATSSTLGGTFVLAETDWRFIEPLPDGAVTYLPGDRGDLIVVEAVGEPVSVEFRAPGGPTFTPIDHEFGLIVDLIEAPWGWVVSSLSGIHRSFDGIDWTLVHDFDLLGERRLSLDGQTVLVNPEEAGMSAVSVGSELLEVWDPKSRDQMVLVAPERGVLSYDAAGELWKLDGGAWRAVDVDPPTAAWPRVVGEVVLFEGTRTYVLGPDDRQAGVLEAGNVMRHGDAYFSFDRLGVAVGRDLLEFQPVPSGVTAGLDGSIWSLSAKGDDLILVLNVGSRIAPALEVFIRPLP
jgi:hypothetical protein